MTDMVGVTITCVSIDALAEVEADLPLALCFRRSWSEGDLLTLRNATEDGYESKVLTLGGQGSLPGTPITFIKDNASTQDDDGASTMDDKDNRSCSGSWSDETTVEDCMDSAPSLLAWADLALETPAPVIRLEPQSDHRTGPPGSWASPHSSATSSLRPGPPGQLAGPPGMLTITSGAPTTATPMAASGCAPPEPSISSSETTKALLDNERTTVVLRNLSTGVSRDSLAEVLDREGFEARYDFVYVPSDFKTWSSLGHAFINFVTPSDAQAAIGQFQGLGLPWASGTNCEADWCGTHQGLDSFVERFRNSPVMHESVPDAAKPAVFHRGVCAAFPAPTRTIATPKCDKRTIAMPK